MVSCPVMKKYLRYKAGSGILSLILEEGLRPDRIRVLAGPAGGPKWFVSVGFDRSLMKTGFLEQNGKRVLLAGSSAGAWRCLAMACLNPLEAYEKLRIAYSRNIFTAQHTPVDVSKALRGNVNDFISDADVAHILNHPSFDLAIHTVRSRGPAASENQRIQGLGILSAALANAITPRGLSPFFERCVFYSGPRAPEFINNFHGIAVPLTPDNLRAVALATGSLPYIISGVKDVAGAPKGTYRDGGVTDYQLNQDYRPSDAGITVFFHYQDRIVPGWFDKLLHWRKPPKGSLDRVLQIYPGEDFLRMLPGGKLPDRNDFVEFVNDPAERIRRWDEVSRLSDILGDEFLDAVHSNKIRQLVKPIEDY
jgi:hypothetical protein